MALAGWVDPDTPTDARETTSLYEQELQRKEARRRQNGRTAAKLNPRQMSLVFSDEFEVDGRTFRDGDDPRWTALNRNDYTNFALHHYSDDNDIVSTNGGTLNITTIVGDRTFDLRNLVTPPTSKGKMNSVTKHYKSGMVQGWNKFCFTGGVVEVRAQLPGHYKTGGLWPALWLMGNLARATYVGSSENTWPWSYDKCDRQRQKGQLFSACNRVNHFGMPKHRGRGAPEIDIMEAMPGDRKLWVTPVDIPYFSSSFQVSPAVASASDTPGPIEMRPSLGSMPPDGQWYGTYSGSSSGVRDDDTVDDDILLAADGNYTSTYLDRRPSTSSSSSGSGRDQSESSLTSAGAAAPDVHRSQHHHQQREAEPTGGGGQVVQQANSRALREATGSSSGSSTHDGHQAGGNASDRGGGSVARGVHGGGGLEYGPDTAQNVFFYGVYLKRRDGSVDGSYQADALSANTALNATHFEQMHTYRLEWEPGPGPADAGKPSASNAGYMRWYVDGKFIYGIDGRALNITGSVVPAEPMYLLMNTAVSSTWGFPFNDCKGWPGDAKSPTDDPIPCYDCRRAECSCWVPEGMCENLGYRTNAAKPGPAADSSSHSASSGQRQSGRRGGGSHFLIDYVRVYQDTSPADAPSSSSSSGESSRRNRHTMGCSPRDYPTRKYIQGNADLFMDTGDTVPLQPLRRGGGHCKLSAAAVSSGRVANPCNSRGDPLAAAQAGKRRASHGAPSRTTTVEVSTFTAARVVTEASSVAEDEDNYCDVATHRCVCDSRHAGPYCKASYGFDDVRYEDAGDTLLFDSITAAPWPLVPPPLALFLSASAVGFVTIVLYIHFFKPV